MLEFLLELVGSKNRRTPMLLETLLVLLVLGAVVAIHSGTASSFCVVGGTLSQLGARGASEYLASLLISV